MDLKGQAQSSEGGYAMAALLVMLAVMAVMLTVAMPVWHQAVQREKEAELVFRGQQYARAIALFQRKFAGAYPPDIDTLVKQKFLRRKYKDPITNGDFQIVYQGTLNQFASQGQRGQAGLTSGNQPSARGGAMGQGGMQPGGGAQGRGFTGSGLGSGFGGGLNPAVRGGMIGVASKSTDQSIRIYNGRNHYNEWQFVYTPASTRPGMPGQPGQPGQPGRGFPGGMGNPGRPGGGFGQRGFGSGQGGFGRGGFGQGGSGGQQGQPPPRPRGPGG